MIIVTVMSLLFFVGLRSIVSPAAHRLIFSLF